MSINQSDHEKLRASGYRDLGDIFSDLMIIDSALFYYNKAKDLVKNDNDRVLEVILDYNIAKVLTLKGEYKHSNKILLPMLKDGASDHQRNESGIRLQVARNYLELRKYDSALYFGRKANSIARIKKSQSQLANASEVLFKSFQALARYDSALYYGLIYYSNRDSIYSIDNQRKLSSLYAEIETLAKQKEIETLAKEKEIDAIHNKNLVLAIILGSLTFVSFLISLILFYRNDQKKQVLNTLMLQQELDLRNKDLHDQTLKMIYMNNSFLEIEGNLKRLHFQSPEVAKEVRQLLSNIQLNKTLEKEWDNFNRYFGNVHGSFFDKINIEFPELSTSEKRLAALIRMNLTNREIASILNIESASVKIAKYRLKKKLNLDEETDIHSFFQNLG
jgi:hypothetical protein